jgi:hypothetical protein
LHWDARRVKNDERDATELAHRLRRNDLPESWIAPPEVRELRELIRYRAKLVALRTSAKAQIHAVMAKLGILPTMTDMFGPTGQVLLDDMAFDGAYGIRVESLRDLLEIYDRELAVVERALRVRLGRHQGYRAIQALNGVGPITAAIFVAEIGDVTRFPGPRDVQLGRGDAHAPRVRHQGPPGSHHQTRLDAGSLGGDRGGGPLPRRGAHRPGVHPYRQAPRGDDRPGGGGEKIAQPGLLRASRRRDPLPGPGDRLSRVGHSHNASSKIDVAPEKAWPGN